jgi:penicillin amidase
VPLAVAHVMLRASLPALDGKAVAPGLHAAAAITRDARGIPTIEAPSRAELAYATGYAHAQDRYFQMDLSRRLAAGELTALFGDAARDQDAKAALFGFRRVARQVLAQASGAQRALVEAYARGANAGLASLRSRPWEYWVLGAPPRPWLAEDTVLVVHAMWWDLQYGGFRLEQLRRQLDARLGGPVTVSGWKRATCFLFPPRSIWDAPNPVPGAPAPATHDACQDVPSPSELEVSAPALGGLVHPDDGASTVGSNNWAVSGSLAKGGGALVASDMHLGLRVPAVWYRARLLSGALDLNGLTLPGAPVLVAGSNGRIAWSFSNSYGDWLDLEHRGCGSEGRGLAFSAPDGRGDCEFATWLAALPEATNLSLLELETAGSVAAALAIAPGVGIPHQNLIVGDRAGHIGWTVIGRIPAGGGAARNDGSGAWLAGSEYPRIEDPPSGRLWAANARVTSDPRQEAIIGDDEAAVGAEYDLGARASQIRDDLFALRGQAAPADMLAIQLDDRALFLARWRELLKGLLDEAALEARPARRALLRDVAAWGGRALPDSTGYRAVRDFRSRVESVVWEAILRSLDIAPDDVAIPARFEAPLWALVTQQPRHLLPTNYPGWRELLLAQADAAQEGGAEHCGRPTRCDWAREPVRIRHPLSAALPFLGPLLDMPAVRLPGDRNMPRVQAGTFGASERFAVTPGREGEGYMHIAGGQSGHPLSPYYRAGFGDWARGHPSPFLPGAAQHRLELLPR